MADIISNIITAIALIILITFPIWFSIIIVLIKRKQQKNFQKEQDIYINELYNNQQRALTAEQIKEELKNGT